VGGSTGAITLELCLGRSKGSSDVSTETLWRESDAGNMLTSGKYVYGQFQFTLFTNTYLTQYKEIAGEKYEVKEECMFV
jgi:hypothetical protein